ncbi:hypothetical protein BDZ94DRAFT_1323669 [Collybia nuda]|uniref:Uncharacterized protein n=1 Tax=Collybia nuda TaxID=64659 RepID=A0A9P6CCQ8_9AGAR|nr:hypothetical protein BDZ94DRAFT_1323669 [Collybia nuda]
MSSTSGVQRNGGAAGSPFDEKFDNIRGYSHPPNNQKRNSMDSVIQYQPPTIQQAKSQEARRPMLPTSVMAAYTSKTPIQRIPSHPALSEQGLQRQSSNTIIPGPPGHSYVPFKTAEDHQSRPSEQAYRDGPQLNFKYDNTTQDPNRQGVQLRHGRPFPVPPQQQARQDQPQQSPQTMTSIQPRPPPPAASSPVTPQPPTPTSNRKPNPPQASPVHPDAIKAAAKALTPIQHLYEEAWVRTVAGVQHEISRMHTELTRLLDVERRQNQMMRVERDAAFEEANRLRTGNAEMREDLKRAAADVQRARLDRDDQAVEFRRLQANNEVLHHQGQVHMLLAQAGKQAQKNTMHSTVESIRAELQQQFDAEMTVKLRELQEERSLRALAEKRLVEATQKLKGITDNLRSASEFCSEQERQSSESATLIGSPEMELSKIKYEREDDTGRVRSPIARGDRVFGSRPPSRTTSHSPLVQTSPPHVKQEPVSARQPTHSPRSLHSSSRVQSPQPLTSGVESPHSLYLHISDTVQDYHTNHTPVPCPSACSDDQPRDKGPDEPPALSVAPRSDPNQRPCSVTPVPLVPPPLPPPARRPLFGKADGQLSPTSEGPSNRSTSVQNNQPPSPRHPFPPRPDYHKSPPLAGPSNQHYRPTANYTPPSPLHSATPISPIVARFAIPLPHPQGNSDHRNRKRSRTEFEPDNGARWPSESRRLAPVRSFTDPSDDRERSRPRPRLDEAPIGAWAEKLPGDVLTSMSQRSPATRAALPLPSPSTGVRALEDGELQTTPTVGTEEVRTAPVQVDVKPQIDKEKTVIARPRLNKIGINHMDLLYETRGDKMICRMCRSHPKGTEKLTPPMTFSTKASWSELVGHCKTEHPKDCGELERLSASQIGELRQRMASSSSAGFMLR